MSWYICVAVIRMHPSDLSLHSWSITPATALWNIHLGPKATFSQAIPRQWLSSAGIRQVYPWERGASLMGDFGLETFQQLYQTFLRTPLKSKMFLPNLLPSLSLSLTVRSTLQSNSPPSLLWLPPHALSHAFTAINFLQV